MHKRGTECNGGQSEINISMDEAESYSWSRLGIGGITPLRRLSWRKAGCRRVKGILVAVFRVKVLKNTIDKSINKSFCTGFIYRI